MLLQRYGAEPPSQALLACLGSRADSAAEELVTRALAGTTLSLFAYTASHILILAQSETCSVWPVQYCAI